MVRLQTANRPQVGDERRSTYMLDSEVAFHAPELLTSAVLQSNLRSLFLIDSWAVGVLIAMLAGGANKPREPCGACPRERVAAVRRQHCRFDEAQRSVSNVVDSMSPIR